MTPKEQSLQERAAAILREVAEFQDTYFSNDYRPRRRHRRRNRRKSRRR